MKCVHWVMHRRHVPLKAKEGLGVTRKGNDKGLSKK